jgi:hypothetical protein
MGVHVDLLGGSHVDENLESEIWMSDKLVLEFWNEDGDQTLNDKAGRGLRKVGFLY